ncbi:glycosyltransferase [Actibacterium ureilyticum]|uniref:glycosyltransferase n=1 Tax=Actibacterium ureilyticum TaxID=1590614 RepID=UPI000BAB0C96|nr:glycosyltransferase [Actibacterium ureilyticum]
MTRLPTILHLIDDTTPGGVMRVLGHLASCPRLAVGGCHVVRSVSRGGALPRVQADIAVSHLALGWRGLLRLVAFRHRHAGMPMVHVEHSYTPAFATQNVPARRRFLTMLRTGYAQFDAVVAVSPAQADWLRAQGLVPPGALRMIRSAVDLSAFRAMRPPSGGGRHIGAIGRLDRQKGFDILIPAFRLITDPQARLTLFGAGPEAARLHAMAAGDARIGFHGLVKTPASAMASVDAVAMPSRWEAYGLVALEARAARRPLALAAVDGLSDHAGPGVAMVPGGSVADWARALRQLMNAPPPPAPRGTLSLVEADFARAWQGVIDDLLARRARPARNTDDLAAPPHEPQGIAAGKGPVTAFL